MVRQPGWSTHPSPKQPYHNLATTAVVAAAGGAVVHAVVTETSAAAAAVLAQVQHLGW